MTVAMTCSLLVLHENARMGHACNVLTGWNRDISEPVRRWSGSRRFRRAGRFCAHLGHRQRKFARRFGRRL